MTMVIFAQWDKKEVKAAEAQKSNVTVPVFKKKRKKKSDS